MILSPLICTFKLLSARIAFCKKHTNRHKIREVLTFQDFPYSGPEGNRTHNHRFHDSSINSVFPYFMQVSREFYKPISYCFFSKKRSFSQLCNTKCNTRTKTEEESSLLFLIGKDPLSSCDICTFLNLVTK